MRTRLFVIALAAALLGLPAPAQAAPDYTQGVTSLSATDARIWFTPTTASSLVDVHYLIGGQGQQNFRMTNNAGTWEKTVGGLASGTVIEYWFTYEKGGPLFDTAHFTYTHNGSGGGGGGSGSFPVTFANNTRGTWANSQIFVTVLGMGIPGEWSYLRPNGTLAHINHLDEIAPGHLTKNGRNFANMSFSLAQAAMVNVPPRLEGGRMYLSLGSPMYIPISPDDRGWGGPDLNNPGDPNIDVYFDWYEFTYFFGQIPFGGNTTQVDMFGFPLTARLTQSAIGYDQTVGITLTRDAARAQYTAAVGAAFRPLVNTYRIVAPRTAASFPANYLQGVIDATWTQYTNSQFTLNQPGRVFTGRVVNGRLQFTKNGAGPFFLSKPSTKDVVACAGALASAGMATTELELGAEFCAAFNRGVAQNTANWYNAASYYPTSVARNDYSRFFHTVGLQGRAYGFAYDDVNDQSSVKILPNANPPTSLTIGIGW
jgi:hypothetical protein